MKMTDLDQMKVAAVRAAIASPRPSDVADQVALSIHRYRRELLDSVDRNGRQWAVRLASPENEVDLVAMDLVCQTMADEANAVIFVQLDIDAANIWRYTPNGS